MSGEENPPMTRIVSANSPERIMQGMELARKLGLEVQLYDEGRFSVTGEKDVVLNFLHSCRKMLMGAELPPTEGVHVVEDLKAMSHDLLPGRQKFIVDSAIVELSSLHPVNSIRMGKIKKLRDEVAMSLGRE